MDASRPGGRLARSRGDRQGRGARRVLGEAAEPAPRPTGLGRPQQERDPGARPPATVPRARPSGAFGDRRHLPCGFIGHTVTRRLDWGRGSLVSLPARAPERLSRGPAGSPAVRAGLSDSDSTAPGSCGSLGARAGAREREEDGEGGEGESLAGQDEGLRPLEPVEAGSPPPAGLLPAFIHALTGPPLAGQAPSAPCPVRLCCPRRSSCPCPRDAWP